MTTNAGLEPTLMLIADCPLCDQPAALDVAAGRLACDGCGVWLELAPDPEPALPLAA